MEELKREDIQENIAVIKINKSYREGMSALELYDVTRGAWKRRLENVEPVEYVLSVSFGVVKEVYHVDAWVPSMELNRETIPYNEDADHGRIGFHGEVADEEIRQKYINKSVGGLFKRGEASPVKVFLNKALDVKNPNDINIDVEPVTIIPTGDEPIVVCPRCETSFIKAPRCPTCGQLIRYKRKKLLTSLEEWEQLAVFRGAKEITSFARELAKNERMGYRLGSSNLMIDIEDENGKKILKVLEFVGRSESAAIYPEESISDINKNMLNKDAYYNFLEEMKPFLSEEQNCTPYEKDNVEYWIDDRTIIENGAKIIEILKSLRDGI